MTQTTAAAPVSTGPPFLSHAERDRRFTAIRERMKALALDVLILPASANRWEQSMADSRYASGIGGFGTETLTIVPRDADPTVYLFNRSGWWKAFPQNWIADVRDGRNRWAANIIERLSEIGFTTGTIGLSGLGGQTRTPDGVIPQRTYETLREAYPGAAFVDATDLIQELRSIKSDEEIGILERAAAITDTMVEAMVAAARPGVTERSVHAAIAHAMLAGGGELPSLFIFASGPGLTTGHGSFVPTDRVLQRGDLLVNELEARVAGYGAQTVAPVWLGTPDPRYRYAVDAATAVFGAVLAEMKPGATMGGLMDTYYAALKRETQGKLVGSFPLMHARGLGDEVPAVIDAADLEKNRDIAIAENMAFVVKPRVREAEGGVSAQVGDTVVVTKAGGRRLGRRTLGLRIIE
jgi:Xaa-Pro dipeptidase